ncbi:uncharacterized protein [Ptychodera flava]|uniref:uncharacterized protein isoform X2 n=1 Tax=Ptychodera flava TaxID=63121 RepID=UPI00396A5AAB
MEKTKRKASRICRHVFGYFILVLLSHNVECLEPHLCKKAIADNCQGEHCKRFVPIKCYHGTCDSKTGECLCSHCWTGPHCDQFENSNAPVFLDKFVEVELDINSDDDVVTAVLARDLDALKCPDDIDCACAKVNYFIDSGNNQSLFMINPHSGRISLSPGKLVYAGLKHILTIGARNEVPNRRERSISFDETPSMSKTTILVSVVSNEDKPHSRRKRSSAGVPDSATFEIEKFGSFESDPSVKVGTTVPMGLTIWLPATITNITAEILTDNNDTALMTLCNVTVTHVGSNFPDLDLGNVAITMDAAAGDYRYDRAVIDFGEVINEATDTSSEDASMIRIKFFAIMQHLEYLNDGDEIFVSAAVEHDDQVWGGQTPFTFVQEDWLKEAAVVTVGGSTELSKLSADVFNFTFELSDPVNDVRIDLFTPYNTTDAFSICRVRIVDMGSSYGCLPEELPQVSYENVTGANSIATVDFGPIVNTGYLFDSTTSEDNTISGQFVVVLTNNTEVVEGEKYWLGVSVVIDDSEIYSSQLAVTANQVAPPAMIESPEISFYAIDSNEVVIGGSVGFIISVTLQERVTTALVIDVSMPFSDDTPIMSICSAKVLSVGFNLPCVGEAIMDYYQEDGSKTDYVQFNFGHVTNVGERHLEGDNTIVVHVTAKLEDDHPAIKLNSTFLVTAGVRYEMADDDVLWIAQNPINVTDDARDYIGDKVPTFQITNRADDNYIYNLSAASFDFEMFIPAATTFEPLTIDISMPVVEHRAFMSVCRVELVYFGANFPCYDTNDVVITYASSQNDDVNDQARVQLGVVSNPELEDTDENREGSKIRFEIHVNMEEHVNLVDRMELWASVDVTISETISWTGQILLISNFDRPDLYTGETEPEYDFYREAGRGRKLKSYGTAIYYVSMATSEQTVTGYTLNVTAANETLSVCRVHMVEAGRNIPCLDLERKASYLAYEENSQFDAAVLDLGPLRNTGLPPTNDDSDNLMVAQIVVQMRPAALPSDNITLPEDQYFSVAMTTGTQDVWTAEDYLTVNVDAPDLNFTVLPEYTLEKLTSESNVMIGGAAVFNLDMYIPYGTIADYQVSFFGDVTQAHKMQVCDVQIVSAGWNIPCVNGSHVGTVYEATTFADEHYDTAFSDTVTITNMELSGTLLDDANKVRVQVVAQLADNETILDGEEFWVGATVSLNDGNLWLLQTPFTATEDVISDEVQGDPLFDLIPPYENVTMTIGSEETYMINITLPPMSTPMVINVSMPYIGDEALLTISKMELVYVGKNFACGSFWELEPEYISDTQTSHNTTAIVDLGIIMNHGTSRYYEFGEYAYEDDDFHITLTVQLTDHVENTNHSIVPFNVTFYYSEDRVVSLQQSIEVLVYGYEEPELIFNLTLAEYDPSTINQGDALDVYGMLQHSNTSYAHAHSVRINFMIPDYLEFSEVMEFEGPEPCITTGDYGVQFHFDEMFFTDYYWFHFNLTVDPQRSIEIGSNYVNTTVPVDTIYYIRESVDNDGMVELGDLYQTETEVLDIVFNIAECYDVIGMATYDPCQFKASSYSDSHTPSESVLSGTGWGAAVRDMAPYTGSEYIQVYFEDKFRVSGITVQWGNEDSLYVTKHKISYSDEELIWHEYQENGAVVEFVNDYNESYAEPWVLHILNEPFEARYVRIVPTEYEAVINNTIYYPIMRFELLGCLKARFTTSSDLCDTTTLPDLGHYERGYIVDPMDGTVFVCILEYIDGPMRCSFSRDRGQSWNAMDTNLANIVALIPDTREIYGIAQNKIAMMRSDDLGESWYSIPLEDYLAYVDDPPPNMVEVEEVPFAYVPDDPQPTFNDSSTIDEFCQWGAAKAGLYKRELLIETTTGLDNSTFWTGSWGNWTLVGEWSYPY